MLFEHHPSHLN
jgi:hypothetical protein